MLEESQHPGRPADPCIIVICGASGDLTKRKLIPALYNLAADRLLSREFAIIGFARNNLTSERFHDQLSQDIKTFATGSVDPEVWDWFRQRLCYVSGDVQDPKACESLKELMAQVTRPHNTHGNCLYYLATAPAFFSEIIRRLGASVSPAPRQPAIQERSGELFGCPHCATQSLRCGIDACRHPAASSGVGGPALQSLGRRLVANSHRENSNAEPHSPGVDAHGSRNTEPHSLCSRDDLHRFIVMPFW